MPEPQSPEKRRVSQACDACKLRKVKCNGQQRCQQCNHLDLRCTYTAARASKQRKTIKRGRLINEYKQSTSQQPLDPSSVPLKPALAPSYSTQSVETVQSTGSQDYSNFDTTPPELGSYNDISPSVTSGPSLRHHDLFTQGYFLDLMPDYNRSVYPVNPIVTEAEVRESIAQMHYDKEHASFVYAFGAVTINLTKCGPKALPNTWGTVKTLCEKSLEARGPIYFDNKASVRKVMTSIFIHICLAGLKNIDMAFFYLREAIAFVQLLRIDNAESMQSLDFTERMRRLRMYWEAFVHERFLAIADHRTVVLPPLQDLPVADPTLPHGVHEGFLQIIKLFKLVDGEFLSNWLGSRESTTLTPGWIEKKQEQLDRQLDASWDPAVAELNDMQQADLLITRHWLRTTVWQMAMSKCLLSSKASKGCMSLMFPVRLSRQLRELISKMSKEAIEIHGSGILNKLFELTDTIADVVIHVPATSLDETANRLEDFLFLFDFLLSFDRFDPVHRKILQEKLETLQSMFPHIRNDVPLAAISPAASTPQDTWLYMASSFVPTEMTPPPMGIQSPVLDRYNGPELPPLPEVLANSGWEGERWHDLTRRLSVV